MEIINFDKIFTEIIGKTFFHNLIIESSGSETKQLSDCQYMLSSHNQAIILFVRK